MSQTAETDKFTLFVYCNFLVLLSTTVCSQNINKQIVDIADENLTKYSFRSSYRYTKIKNYLKRLYRIRHWIPMFIGTPSTLYRGNNIPLKCVLLFIYDLIFVYPKDSHWSFLICLHYITYCTVRVQEGSDYIWSRLKESDRLYLKQIKGIG